MNQEVLAQLKTQLEVEKASLDRQLADYGATEDGIDMTHGGFADSGHATAERTEALGIVDVIRTQRAEVLAALARIDAGEYGRCERCGQEIPEARLQAVPAARLCVSCKQGS